MLIESLCGTMEAVVCLGHGGVPRSEIPEQSKRAGSLRTGLTTAVKIQTRFKIAVHASHSVGQAYCIPVRLMLIFVANI